MSSIVYEGEAPESDDETIFTAHQPNTSKRKPPKPTIYEGEASETDEESEKAEMSKIPEVIKAFDMPVPGKSRPRVHIDERLEQQWKNLASDTLVTQWRRNQTAQRMINDTLTHSESAFQSIQSTSSKVRLITDNLCQLEHVVEQLVDNGLRLLPEKIKTNFQMPKEFL
ncbi:unnamed protein product, partial [Mesorhabditis belari]|uniref:Biogenesis of lysosome-related organelles complex 1 subunit 3 n=1 Tax=Mesorhabditis belari TaxID=2138241 RepID=A0AAF3J810_9BILA